jgi:hypothetical protein
VYEEPTTETLRHGAEQVFTAEARRRGERQTSSPIATADIDFVGKMLPRGELADSEMQVQTASGA